MARYTYTLRQEIGHQGLNKYRVVTAQNRYELNQKIAAIQAQWDEQWRRKCEVEACKVRKNSCATTVSTYYGGKSCTRN